MVLLLLLLSMVMVMVDACAHAEDGGKIQLPANLRPQNSMKIVFSILEIERQEASLSVLFWTTDRNRNPK